LPILHSLFIYLWLDRLKIMRTSCASSSWAAEKESS